MLNDTELLDILLLFIDVGIFYGAGNSKNYYISLRGKNDKIKINEELYNKLKEKIKEQRG